VPVQRSHLAQRDGCWVSLARSLAEFSSADSLGCACSIKTYDEQS